MLNLDGWTVDKVGTLYRPNGQAIPTDNPLASGYLQVSITTNKKRKMYKQHRVAHFLRTGEWPEMIDHLNGIKDDNSEGNLVASDASLNQRNQYTHREGTCGIQYRVIAGKAYYRVRVRPYKGKQVEKSTTCPERAKIMLDELREELWHTND